MKKILLITLLFASCSPGYVVTTLQKGNHIVYHAKKFSYGEGACIKFTERRTTHTYCGLFIYSSRKMRNWARKEKTRKRKIRRWGKKDVKLNSFNDD